MDHIVNGISKAKRPYITHQDRERFITGITDGTVIGYKYFAFNGNYTMSFRVRGDGNGTLTASLTIPSLQLCQSGHARSGRPIPVISPTTAPLPCILYTLEKVLWILWISCLSGANVFCMMPGIF